MSFLRGKPSQGKHSQHDPRVFVTLEQLRQLEYKARGFSFLPRQPARSALSGRHGSRLRGRGLNFEELRHYRPGDDIRAMDWKVTNRTGKPHVRVYTEERERSVQLLVDQRVSMFFGSTNAMKSVIAAQVAALAAWRVIATGDRLGGLVFGDRQQQRVPPRRSKDNVIALLSRIVAANGALAAGQQPQADALNTALDAISRDLGHDNLVIYIGDGFGWNARSTRIVRRLSQHNDFIAVNVQDRAELELPKLREFIVSDGALQISVDGSNSALRRDFSQTQSTAPNLMRNALKREQLSLLNIDTASDPLEQLLKALGGVR